MAILKSYMAEIKLSRACTLSWLIEGHVAMLQVGLQLAISELSFASVSKRLFVGNHSYKNPSTCRFIFMQTHFHMKVFARSFVLK